MTSNGGSEDVQLNGSSDAASASASSATTAMTELSMDDAPTASSASSASATLVAPLPTKGEYVHARALEDISGAAYALNLFLASQMVESEEYCHTCDPKKERLYFATGYGLIQCIKAFMSYEDEDLLAAIGHTRHGNTVAQLHRKKAASFAGRLAGYVMGSSSSSGVGFIKSMTPVERHAELVYAESLFEKTLLGIVYSGDWMTFIKEALNLQTTVGVYRKLLKYMVLADEEATARGEGPEDISIDQHFRSGVLLGNGCCHLVLSLLPSRVLSIVELFGYKGDRKKGLALLQKAGGWTTESDEPTIDYVHEGVRRSICDMAMLMFHLVVSSFTFACVDIAMAEKILNWNLKRYPNGVFFLLSQGRLRLIRGQPGLAIQSYKKAIESQSQYRNLHHMSYWEMAISYFAIWDIPASLECWRHLAAEATWSKAVYAYGVAVSLLQIGGEENYKEAEKFFDKVPTLMQRIAGKSIPLEKYVARKARKFKSQGGRLSLAALELTYLLCIARAPRASIIAKMLPEVEAVREKLKASEFEPDNYENGQGGYWDDLCLMNLLDGVCLRYVAYPDPDATVDPNEVLPLSREEAETRSAAALRRVMEYGPQIELDHYIVYAAHYELGRLLACMGKTEEARKQFEMVLSGKPLEINTTGKKGKYSLESTVMMKTTGALEGLDQGRRL